MCIWRKKKKKLSDSASPTRAFTILAGGSAATVRKEITGRDVCEGKDEKSWEL